MQISPLNQYPNQIFPVRSDTASALNSFYNTQANNSTALRNNGLACSSIAALWEIPLSLGEFRRGLSPIIYALTSLIEVVQEALFAKNAALDKRDKRFSANQTQALLHPRAGQKLNQNDFALIQRLGKPPTVALNEALQESTPPKMDSIDKMIGVCQLALGTVIAVLFGLKVSGHGELPLKWLEKIPVLGHLAELKEKLFGWAGKRWGAVLEASLLAGPMIISSTHKNKHAAQTANDKLKQEAHALSTSNLICAFEALMQFVPEWKLLGYSLRGVTEAVYSLSSSLQLWKNGLGLVQKKD